MPYQRHYSLSFFTNQGELSVDNYLFSEMSLNKEKWVGLHSINLNRLHRSTAGECDFIIINPHGIMVLEVKASEVKVEDGVFYQKEKGEFKERSNFFTQATRNANFIMSILHEKRINDVMVIHACVFPESTFFDGSGRYGVHWSLATKEKQSLTDFIAREFSFQRNNFAEQGMRFSELNASKIDSLTSLLSPQIQPTEVRTHLMLQAAEAKNKAQYNLQMLEGLLENKRLLVQGPAGSGKSTFAKSLAFRKAMDENKKVLYLCWNELLAIQTKQDLEEQGVQTIDVFPLYPFWIHLCKQFDLEQPINYDWVQNQELRNFGLQSLYQMLSTLEHSLYDYVIVDEAQDMFHFDLFSFVYSLLGKSSQAAYALFYDNTQAFVHNHVMEEYQLAQELFKEECAIYQLHQRYRGIAGMGLFEFLKDLEFSLPNLSKKYGDDVIIKKYNNSQIKELLEGIVVLKKQMKSTYGVDYSSQILLLGSNLVSGLISKKRPMDEILSLYSNHFHPMNEDFFEVTDQLLYSTPGTVKGLERDIVYLVVSDYLSKQHLLKEFYLGASRTKVRLYVFVIDCSK